MCVGVCVCRYVYVCVCVMSVFSKYVGYLC